MPSGDISHGLPSHQRGRLARLWDSAQEDQLWNRAWELLSYRRANLPSVNAPAEDEAMSSESPARLPEEVPQPRTQQRPMAAPTGQSKPHARGYLGQAIEPDRVRVNRQALEGRSSTKQGWQRIEDELKEGG